jgi:transposase InsO family protein
LDSRLAQQALAKAIQLRGPKPGLIHHSDRGVQYACREYVTMLQQSGIEISMSRPGNPYDNAFAESFMKTLKAEEIDGRRYRDLEDAIASIGVFIEGFYNIQRLHSALGYRSPVEFELNFATSLNGERGILFIDDPREGGWLPPSLGLPSPAQNNKRSFDH